MEKQITIKQEYNSLENLLAFLQKDSSLESSIEYDAWDVRTDANGQMEQCVVIKKSAMHGLKGYFTQDNQLKLSYIIPNKVMNAYFGKSQKRYQNPLEIITNKIKDTLLAVPQQKAFDEMEQVFTKILA